MRLARKLLILLFALIALGLVALVGAVAYDAPCQDPQAVAEGVPTMRAAWRGCYGDSGVLRLVDAARPEPAAGQVLVRVHAASVNPLDWHYLHGKPWIMRLSSGIGRPEDPRLGVDFAGVVAAVGEGVTRFRPGDRVFGGAGGAFAEYLVVREDRNILPIPDGIGFEDAAAVQIAGVTALQAVRDAGKVGPGSRVLVNGASGGVGVFAVQIAKAMGAEVTAVSSGRNTALVASLGADHTIDYREHDFTRGDQRWDVIIDNVGNHPLSAYRRALEPDGIHVMVTGPKSNPVLGPVARVLWAAMANPFTGPTHASLMAESRPEDLAVLRDMLADGRLRPVIDRRFGLDEVPAAIDYLGEGRTRGKNLIVVLPEAGDAGPSAGPLPLPPEGHEPTPAAASL